MNRQRTLLFCLITILLITGPAFAVHATDVQTQSPAGQDVFFPILRHTVPPLPAIGDMQAIWHSEPFSTDRPDFALFRKTFTLPENAASTLAIFAESRYVLYVDGRFVGRGPARYAYDFQEYDHYSLDLAAGEHTIAVLVSFSQEERRSVAIRPALLARLWQGSSQDELLETDAGWKALATDAWNQEAPRLAEVIDLIGHTELLDLRRLPADWYQPGFDDSSWPNAVEIYRADVVFTPRSTAPTVDIARPLDIIERGALSPGFDFAILPAGITLPLTSTLPVGSYTIETLSDSDSGGAPSADLFAFNSLPINWQAADPLNRPGVFTAPLESDGTGELAFQKMPELFLSGVIPLPERGWAFSLNGAAIDLPFSQGDHAGHRNLLANPVPDPQAVTVTRKDAGTFDITFHTTPAYIVLEAPRTVHGRLTATVSGPTGAVVDIGLDERLLRGTNRVLAYPGSLHNFIWNQTDSFVLDGNTRPLTTIDARAGRYIMISVWNADETVTLQDVQFREEIAPSATTQPGAFSSSDPLIDEIWQIGVDTLLPSISDAYMDPWRERGTWWGDVYVMDQINRVSLFENDVFLRSLRVHADTTRFTGGWPVGTSPVGLANELHDYQMEWVMSVREYAERSGDVAIISEMWDAILLTKAHMDAEKDPATGLLDLPGGHWSKNAYIDSYALEIDRSGVSTAVNALYYATLLDLAVMADAISQPTAADAYRTEAGAVKDAINQYLYDPDAHRYYASSQENWTVFTSKNRIYAQALPLAYGIVPEDQVPLVADELVSMLSFDPDAPNNGSLIIFWLLKALAHADRHAIALDFVRAHYGNMIADGATTWWESFIVNNSALPQQYTGSMSHGWTGSPTWFLTEEILGAKAAGIEWRLAPHFVGAASVSGTLPLRGGAPLEAGWEITASCRSAILHIDSLRPGRVEIPAAIRIDNLDSLDLVSWVTIGDRTIVRLNPGAHRLELSESSSCYLAGP